jgi:D-alanyl-D-alanine carboxypeptidase/D-alanyl-D-alanine-endopeptidase (penicillin-binding protein 4)
MIAAAIIAALLVTGCGGTARPRVAPDPHSSFLTRLHRDIDALVSTPALQHATWGIVARSLDTGETLYSRNPRTLLVPGSNAKIPTLAAAAERLGWNFSYETRVLAVGAIDFGFLDGDLLVVGTGDPSLDDWDGAATQLFAVWAERLKASGIRTVGGRLIGDDNDFDEDALGAGWAWDDLGASFAAGAGALQFNQNTVRVSIAPGSPGHPAIVDDLPAGSGLAIRSRVVTVGPAEQPSILARRLPGSYTIDLTGTVAADQPPVFRNVSVDNPTRYFLNRLLVAFDEHGIEVRGRAVDIDDISDAPRRDAATPLIVHRSPPLSELAGTMMKMSQNLYAETLIRTAGGPSPVDTMEAGRRAVRETMQAWGVNTEELTIADGSGLSRYNLATAEALVAILTRVHRDDRLREAFEASLPLAGREGTLSGRMIGTAAEGNARAKSGSLSNARALSGYVRTASGEPVVFSILTNNFGGPAGPVEAAQDAIVARLATFARH